MCVQEGLSCALRSSVQRVNGSLGSLLNDAYVCCAAPEEKDGSDWNLRWTNAALTQVRQNTVEQKYIALGLGVDRE